MNIVIGGIMILLLIWLASVSHRSNKRLEKHSRNIEAFGLRVGALRDEIDALHAFSADDNNNTVVNRHLRRRVAELDQRAEAKKAEADRLAGQ